MNDVTRLIAYAVKEVGSGRNRQTYFTKIGVVFPHREGPGFNVELDALPVNGRIVILPPREEKEQTES